MPKHASIKAVRGKGLMLGVVLDYPAGELLPHSEKQGADRALAGETVLRLVPPPDRHGGGLQESGQTH